MLRRVIAPVASVALICALSGTGARADAPAFGTPVTLAGGNEPEIAVDHQTGVVYVDWPNGTPGRSSIYRSTDGGAHFSNLPFGAVHQRLPGGGDGAIATRGQAIYFLDLWLASDTMSVSLDGGTTWTIGNPVATLPVSDRQWLALGPRDPITGLDTVYALYGNTPLGHRVATSTTSGLTWTSDNSAPGSGPAGRLVSDGNQFIAFEYRGGGNVNVATSANAGASWTTHQIATGSGGGSISIPALAMDGDLLHAVWVAADQSIRIKSSPDRGETWGGERLLSNPGTTNVFPWVDARNGKVAVAWYGADVVAKSPDTVPDGTKWYARYAESLDAGSSYSSQVDVGFARNDYICTRGLNCDPLVGGDGHRELGDFMSVAIDGAGKSLVTYVRVSAVKVAKQL